MPHTMLVVWAFKNTKCSSFRRVVPGGFILHICKHNRLYIHPRLLFKPLQFAVRICGIWDHRILCTYLLYWKHACHWRGPGQFATGTGYGKWFSGSLEYFEASRYNQSPYTCISRKSFNYRRPGYDTDFSKSVRSTQRKMFWRKFHTRHQLVRLSHLRRKGY